MKPLSRPIVCTAMCLALSLVACGDDNPANTGNEVVEACSEIECPPGTTRYQDSSAEAECSASGSLDILTESGSVSGKCLGSGECLLICQPPEPCCGGEEWTETSYTCETPCAATCSCDGKCGVVTGADCEADCGSCGGGQVCSDNVCMDECPEGSEPCGDACALIGEVYEVDDLTLEALKGGFGFKDAPRLLRRALHEFLLSKVIITNWLECLFQKYILIQFSFFNFNC